MKRPLFAWALAVLAATAAFFCAPAKVGIAVFFPTAAAALLCLPQRRRIAVFLCAGAIVGFAYAAARETLEMRRLSPLVGQTVSGTLAVGEAVGDGAGCRLTGSAVLETPDGRKLRREITLIEQSGQSALAGEALSFSALCQRADAGGISLLCKEILPDRRDAPRAALALSRLRRAVTRAAGEVAGGEGRGVLIALLAGDRSALSSDTLRAWQRAGMSHLLVVSGLHLCLAASFVPHLPPFRRRRRLGAAAAVVFVWLLALLTGMGIAAVRAALMLTPALTAPLFGRRGDALTSLGFACLVIVLVSPRAVLSVSFWLSVCATLGILLLSGPIGARLQRRLPQRRPVQDAAEVLAVSAAALVGTIPISALAFGTIPVVGLLANLAAAPLLMPTLLTGAAAVACPPLRIVLAPLCRALLWLLCAVARAAARLPLGRLGLSERWQGLFIAGAYALALLGALRPVRKTILRRAAILLAAGLALCCAAAAIECRLCVTATLLPRDGLVLLTKGNRAVLFGSPDSPDAAERAEALLARQNVAVLECVWAPNGLTADGAALVSGFPTAAVAVLPSAAGRTPSVESPVCEIPASARVLGCVRVEASGKTMLLLSAKEDCQNGAGCVIIGDTLVMLGKTARALPPLGGAARVRIPVRRLP